MNVYIITKDIFAIGFQCQVGEYFEMDLDQLVQKARIKFLQRISFIVFHPYHLHWMFSCHYFLHLEVCSWFH